MKKYDPKKIEGRWQKKWQSEKTFVTKDSGAKEKYILVEFPYPSGAGLHMGHMRPYMAGDISAKYWRLKGYNTMYPIGWDAFGLPAENYAIKNKVHPEVSTKKNIANAKRQLASWGTGFDWSREINTTDPDYYKWTQKIFLEFLKAGLAYEATGLINWCPKDKTGLANEEVIDGKCERCGSEVEKKELRQWYLKITDYAEKLLEGLKDLPEWPEAVKLQQANWIGKSEGAEIDFYLNFKKDPKVNENRGPDGKAAHIPVFTTRPDTIFGATYLVLSPEHLWVTLATDDKHDVLENKEEVKKYIENVKGKSDIERTALGKEKTGVELKGVKAINPATGEEIPMFIADYVLAGYGTGAIMAVPAHDERDYDFAKKFDLPIRQVVAEHFVDINTPPREGKRHAPRVVVQGIVRNTKNNTVLQIVWKKFPWKTFVIGGAEDGESLEDAVKREVFEETGYKNFSSIRKIGSEMRSEWYAEHKDENRYAHMHVYELILENDEHEEISGKEKEKHEIAWVPFDSISTSFKPVSEMPAILAGLNKKEAGVFAESGILINSGKFSEKNSEEVKKDIVEFVGGKIVTKYKLRDWVFSRQRYWGEPIPVIHCDKCGIVPVPEKDLPVKLPKVKNYEPTGTGESPLAAIEKWVNVKCPSCEQKKKETKYLVFDFDGVLGDTWEAHLHARVNMGDSPDLKDAVAKAEKYFETKPWHSRGEKYDESIHIDWSTRFAKELAKLEYDLFTDFLKEIGKIKNAKVAIVSAGSKIYSEAPIKKAKFKHTHFLGMEDHHSKEEKLEMIAEAWKVDVTELYYFTDTKADVYELENLLNRKKIIGCAWGYAGEEKLKQVLPENQILKKFKDIHKVFEPGKAKRETNTMPQWAGSSWYWLRYTDPKNKKEFADQKKQKYWTPVDLYFGGMEHTTLHLLYSRFWNLFLHDRGLVTAKEPYMKRVPHGIILGPDGEKMSKSRGNVVNPDDIIALYGADTVRVYMAFLGPHGAQVAWNDKGIIGARRFLERVFAMKEFISKNEDKNVTTLLHKTIKKVGEDVEAFSFNTAISSMMIFVNTVFESKKITKKSFEIFLIILSAFAPHLSEEIWKELGHKKTIFTEKWPTFDPKLLVSDTVKMVVQINGKVRAEIEVGASAEEKEIVEKALSEPKIGEYLEGKEIRKTIVVKGKIVNFVV